MCMYCTKIKRNKRDGKYKKNETFNSCSNLPAAVMVPEAAFHFLKRVKNTDYRNVNKMTQAKISRALAGDGTNTRQCSPIVCERPSRGHVSRTLYM